MTRYPGQSPHAARPRDDGGGQPQKTFAAAVIFRYQTMSNWFGGLAPGYRFHRADCSPGIRLQVYNIPTLDDREAEFPHEIRKMKVFAKEISYTRPITPGEG